MLMRFINCSELLHVFLVFTGVPGLHHALVGVCFNLHPGVSFKIDMLCDFNALDNLENTRHQWSYIKKQEDKASECFS